MLFLAEESNHTKKAILKSNRTVYTFGFNDYGQLGNRSNSSRNSPVPVVDNNGDIVEDIIAVSCGGEHTAILKSDGTIYTFGRNDYGQLGSGYSYQNSNIPLKVEYIYEDGLGLSNIGKDVIAVSCGYSHTLILKSDGTVISFGRNFDGELGFSSPNLPYEEFPKLIPGVSDIIDISAGKDFSAILKSDGTLYTFGFNGSGQLGLGNSTTGPYTPTQIETHSDIIAVSCGYYHTAIIKQNLDIGVSTHQFKYNT